MEITEKIIVAIGLMLVLIGFVVAEGVGLNG